MTSETKAASAHGPSFLRWAGSKRKSLALLSSAYLNSDHHYIEPFAGSAALFFCLKPRQGTLADLNGHLVNAMRHVRDKPRDLHRRLSLMPRTSRAYYRDNRAYFEGLGFNIIIGLRDDAVDVLAKALLSGDSATPSIFIDISSMSREMIANIALAIQRVRSEKTVSVAIAYAPSKFSGPYAPAPIRLASPIKPSLAGWSSQPEMPLGAIFGLGCEPDLALGALQLLEPNKAWIFKPKGIDPKFDAAMRAANLHIEDIFDVSNFSYEISKPASARGRLEALLNAIDKSFRLIIVPFGPKIFAWLAISAVVFSRRSNVGVWAFSSKEHGSIVDRDAEGQVIWHSLKLEQPHERKIAPSLL
jgi:D12 class N6 adenine-specific DNA methyltransferase